MTSSAPICYVMLLLLLLAAAGCHGCFGRSNSPTRTTTTTTTQNPVLEGLVDAKRAATNDNAWTSGAGIDWSHVAPAGQPNSNRTGSSSSGSSSGGSSISSPSISGRLPPPPSTPQSVSKGELRQLSRDLLQLDTNSVGHLITLSAQGKTSSSDNTDHAPNRLFSSVPQEALRGPTISKLLALLDNYEPAVTQAERDTSQEREEQQAFLDAVMATSVMTKTEQFLNSKGLLSGPLRQVLQEIWFTPYTRHRNTLSSSGFEHVFVGELKGRKVSGFHNWVSFYKEEQEGDLNYMGYMKEADLGNEGSLITLKFTWLGDKKPVGSMFVGTSPELEMALYTVCFYARPGNNCPMELNGKRFSIKTYYQNYQGKRYVGTAYPLL